MHLALLGVISTVLDLKLVETGIVVMSETRIAPFNHLLYWSQPSHDKMVRTVACKVHVLTLQRRAGHSVFQLKMTLFDNFDGALFAYKTCDICHTSSFCKYYFKCFTDSVLLHMMVVQ